jgi:hypothetical protein
VPWSQRPKGYFAECGFLRHGRVAAAILHLTRTKTGGTRRLSGASSDTRQVGRLSPGSASPAWAAGAPTCHEPTRLRRRPRQPRSWRSLRRGWNIQSTRHHLGCAKDGRTCTRAPTHPCQRLRISAGDPCRWRPFRHTFRGNWSRFEPQWPPRGWDCSCTIAISLMAPLARCGDDGMAPDHPRSGA